MDHRSETEQRAGFGLVRSVYMIVASTGSIVVEFIADCADWAVTFGALAALLVVVLCLLASNRALERLLNFYSLYEIRATRDSTPPVDGYDASLLFISPTASFKESDRSKTFSKLTLQPHERAANA